MTNLGILEQALANMPDLRVTWEGGPSTDIHPKFYKIPAYPPQDDAEDFRQQLNMPCEPDDRSKPESEEVFNKDDEWFNPHEEEDLNFFAGYG